MTQHIPDQSTAILCAVTAREGSHVPFEVTTALRACPGQHNTFQTYFNANSKCSHTPVPATQEIARRPTTAISQLSTAVQWPNHVV
eukprot:CAMPEP_0174296560 /NCGR_PEP_ID=MMETSP0809-20121228/48242_1 /TAXON_ID=73025 ORGANISM="Eutreptiella gymnastica-like, Strain CCMP1594" /NCGR_SAMPLE_ID=MMETSP0809 /ASSEMBLY_ACC=CAM_ASM_000658 /LENGTH=85 /DNA_ID=CAMNT_0015399647 /DNA_START=94 /DNA_END=351 /DNA_ORIENTATION=-